MGWGMHELLEAIKSGMGHMLGEAVTEVLVPVLLLLGLFVLASPIYLLLKFLSPKGRQTSFKQDLLDVVNPRPQSFSELSPGRQEFLRSLDQVDRGVSLFYEYFI